MEMVAHNPKMAKKVGVPQSVGKDFVAADKGKKFGVGGTVRTDLQKANEKKTDHGSTKLFKEGGAMKSDMKEDTKMDMAQDKKLIKKAFKQHDAQEHKGGKGTTLKLKKGGMAMKEIMGPRTMAKDVEAGSNKLTKFGQSALQKRGITKGTNLGDSGPTASITKGMKKGGCTKMCRGGGIETKGKTKGRMV